jgi:hypothetical protein
MNRTEFDAHVNVLGVPGSHRTVATPEVVTALDKVLCGSIGRVATELPLVNAYGITARQIHIKASSLLVEPVKFDVVTVGGKDYVLEAVLPKLEVGTGIVMGWVCYSVGD